MEIINDSSIFTDGKYEILYASKPYLGDDGNVDYSKAICSLNGADVNDMAVDLSCHIHWKEQGKIVDFVSFIMPRDDAKLSDVFTTTPYGLIKKNRTGVGATTLELNSNRNSIVVVPTKSLAHNKAKQSLIDGTNKYRILYVGSSISGFSTPTIPDYLHDNDIPIKKFVVVADSLPRLLQTIGGEHFADYFLMIDEIDSYQYDSSFRSALEDALDYYWKFPSSKRCLVSATMGTFTDSRIGEEAITEVYFNEEQRRNIHLIHTNSVEVTAKREIERIAQEFPNDKILIAYNSVSKGIQPIIMTLPETLQSKCSVLCSVKSKNIVGDKYAEIIDNGALPTQITFMTCTYFVGIDIQERFHLISIANADIPHSLLSVDKLQQIAGRCRDSRGLLSETIVYKTRNYVHSMDLISSRQQLLNEAEFLCSFYNSFGRLQKDYRNIYQYIGEYDANDFIEDSKRRYLGIATPYAIIRKSYDALAPAYFVIDSLLIQAHLCQDLYSTSGTLFNMLSSNNNVVFSSVGEDVPDTLENIRQELSRSIDERQTDEIDRIIEELRRTPTEERLRTIYHLQNHCANRASRFLEQFAELQEYVPFDILVHSLKDISREAKYKKFRNATIFFALDEAHPLKQAIVGQFIQGEKYTGEEILTKLNVAWSSVLGLPLLTSSSIAIKKLRTFCTLKTSSKRVEGNANPERAYKIDNYDANCFGCVPLSRIDATTNARNLIRF